MNDDMTTGQCIKAARKKAGLTQKALGEKLGIAYQTVAQWENDLRNPKIDTIRRIAVALNIDPYSLMDFDMATDEISKQSEDEWKYKEKISQNLDKLTTEGLKILLDVMDGIIGNPKYHIMTEEEFRAELDTEE